MTKFKVGDKVKVLDVSKINLGGNHYFSGMETEVMEIDGDWIHLKNTRGEKGVSIRPNEIDAIQLIESKPTKNQRITKLESEIAELLPLKEEVKELKLIVHQLRTPSTVNEEVSTSSVEDTIEYEGQQYKKVDRLAREGDVVILTSDSLPHWFTKGKPYKINKNRKIWAPEHNVGEYSIYSDEFGRTPETVDVYELIVEDNPFPPSVIPKPVKSPNQLRAEIIEKAKGFVEKTKTPSHRCRVAIGEGYENEGKVMVFENTHVLHQEINSKKYATPCDVTFYTNEAKRTVVAVLRSKATGIIRGRGITKCHPNNVFNEHIGRAIALGRALGLDVSEFEQAVQPTELVIGMKVELLKQLTHPNNRAGAIKLICDKGFYTEGGPKCAIDSNVAKNSRIINDTNAIYGDTK